MNHDEIKKRLVELRSFIYKDNWNEDRTRQTFDVILGLIIDLIPPDDAEDHLTELEP